MLNVNMKFNKYWFKPKKFGYGAYPITWEGWLITLLFLALAVFVGNTYAVKSPYIFFFLIIFMAIGLVIFSRNKTDGKWKWRWG